MTVVAADVVARTFRVESRQVLATLARALGSLDDAEDAIQDAFTAALEVWPRTGIPDRPAAWITTTARHRAIDRRRREAKRSAKERRSTAELGWYAADPEPEPVQIERNDAVWDALPDDQLRLIFACCHPSLSTDAQVTLTLRLVCGFQTPEVARALLLPEPTVAQRLVRAKRKIRDAGIPLRVPFTDELAGRLPAVLACVYVVFGQGYAAGTGSELIRDELCDEGIRLGRLLVDLLPDEPEVIGLLALMLLHDSRRATRLTPDGAMVLLADQDRSCWDHDQIDAGARLVVEAMRRRRVGPYQLQAAIAACHATAPRFADTDWNEVLGLYDVLLRVAPSPVIELNRAVAVSFVHGPAAALDEIDRIAADPHLGRTHQTHAVRADILRRLDRLEEAAHAYQQALAAATTSAERRFLEHRLAEVT